MAKGPFRLAGLQYTLERAEVEERLQHVEPKAIDTYYVSVNGKNYPPKQVMAVALNKPLASFTTMEAIRVLKNLGFELGVVEDGRTTIKTESELLFAEYLISRGVTNFSLEKDFAGTSRKPDYSLWHGDKEILFELKEFHATPSDIRLGFGYYDPYGPIREKIEEGRRKFKDLEAFCCCLVLYNREKPLVDLSWEFIYGAMLGNLAFQFPVDLRTGKGDAQKMTRAFGGGGKMHQHNREGFPVKRQNTTISAVLALSWFSVGKRRFELEIKRKERELGHKFSLEETLEEINRTQGTEKDISLRQLRVVVCENPYARPGLELPRDLFRGPHDERYGPSEGHIERVFAGEQIVQLETQEQAATLPAAG